MRSSYAFRLGVGVRERELDNGCATRHSERRGARDGFPSPPTAASSTTWCRRRAAGSCSGSAGARAPASRRWPPRSPRRTTGSVVPMDGFHLADVELVRRGLRDRKGAPETFDADGYAALLARLRAAPDQTVMAPAFERDLEQPLAGAIAVPPRGRPGGDRGQLPAARRAAVAGRAGAARRGLARRAPTTSVRLRAAGRPARAVRQVARRRRGRGWSGSTAPTPLDRGGRAPGRPRPRPHRLGAARPNAPGVDTSVRAMAGKARHWSRLATGADAPRDVGVAEHEADQRLAADGGRGDPGDRPHLAVGRSDRAVRLRDDSTLPCPDQHAAPA